MTLIQETGDAVEDANSYVTVAEADDYFSRHPTSAQWAAKSTADKETLLITAARTLDYGAQWKGTQVDIEQAMQWPRENVIVQGQAWASTKIPRQVRNAQCELAALFITGNRLADQDADGIKSVSLGKGALQVEFDASTAKTMLGRAAPDLIAMFANGNGGRRGMVPVVRM